MRRHCALGVAAVIVATATTVAANDFSEACEQFGSAEVIFVGRVKSAPITRRISAEDEIEKARLAMVAAERDLKAVEALKMPPEIGGGQKRELAIRLIKASDEYNRTRAMHPPPVDFPVTPILVETPFRGVTTPELFMWNRGQPPLDPSRSYLFYAQRPMGPLAPDIIDAGQPKDVEAAEDDLRFLHEAVTSDQGTIVHGSLNFQDPDDQTRRTPLPGVVLRVSLDGQHYESSTGADGTFIITGVPPGVLRIDPVLPDHLMLPPQQNGGIVKGGCLAVHMRAAFNGRVRGRVGLDTGAPFRGVVDLVPDDHQRHLPNSHALTNERGEFAFSALPPGNYLVGINISRQPSSGSPFRPTYFPGTTDRSEATRVVVGAGTEQSDVDWMVSARLPEGSIEVSLDTHGQPQKNMGVCMTTFDADNRHNSGIGYARRADEPVILPVVEGVRYRFVAHAQTASGFVESDVLDLIGTSGRHVFKLPVGFTTRIARGYTCASPNALKPFSLPR